MPDAGSPFQLLRVRSQRADTLLAHLDALDESLAASPLLGRVGRRLDDVRVPLRVLELEPVHDPEPVPARRDGRDYGSSLPLDDAASRVERMVLLGGPGSGKTEWLKRHARDVARHMRAELERATTPLDDLQFPVYLRLQDVERALLHGGELRTFLDAHGCGPDRSALPAPARRMAGAMLMALLERPGLPTVLLPWVWQRLTRPRSDRRPALLLCLDAWDEVRAGRRELAEHLREFARVADARIVLTSRILGEDERLVPRNLAATTLMRGEPGSRAVERTEVGEFELCPYACADTNTFVQGFFRGAPGSADDMLHRLRDKPALAGMSANPLLATLVCLAFADAALRRPPSLPCGTRSTYERVLTDLLVAWDGIKRYDLLAPPLDTKDIEPTLRMLQTIALHFFPAAEMSATALAAFLGGGGAGRLRGPDAAERAGEPRSDDAHTTLDELCRAGVLVRGVAHDGATYRFLHRSLQEHLVARALARRADEQGWDAIAVFVDRATRQPAVWQEVLALLAGGLGDSPHRARLFELLLAHSYGDDDEGRRCAVAASGLTELSPAGDGVRELASRVTSAVFSRWCRYAIRNCLDVVPHLTRALPALAAWNTGVRYSEPEVTWDGGSDHAAATAPTLLDLVVLLLQHPHDGVRSSAVEAVRALRSLTATGEFLDTLTTLLRDPAPELRQTAVEAVVALGATTADGDMVAALAALLQDPKHRTRSLAVQAVRVLGPAATTPEFLVPLAALLRHPHDQTRQSALHAVGQIGPTAAHRDILDALAAGLRDPSLELRSDTLVAVRALGVAAAERGVLGGLAGLLRDPDFPVLWTVNVVDALGPAAADSCILSALASVLSRPEEHSRWQAVRAVRALGAAAATPEFLAALAALLGDPSAGIRWAAASTAVALGPAAATPEFLSAVAALLRQRGEIRWPAVHVMRELAANTIVATELVEAADDDVLLELAAQLGDPKPGVQVMAAFAIHAIGPAAATPKFLAALADLLQSPERTPWVWTLMVVRALGPAAATAEFLARLSGLLSSSSAQTRWSAQRVLEALGPAAATAGFLGALAASLSRPDGDVRRLAMQALEALWPAAADGRVVTALTALSQDSDVIVRSSAEKALRALERPGAHVR